MKTIGKLHTHDHAPATEGRTIRWAHLYDALVGVMTLGKGQAIRETTAAMETHRRNTFHSERSTHGLTMRLKSRLMRSTQRP